MGESFKLHAQALIGYVDEIGMDTVPGMAQIQGQNMMGIETAY